MFKKILIANRGEIAVRIIRACRDLGVSPAAVYSEADRDALHVKLADQAFPIGPAPASESYLVVERILEAARQAGAEAVHPGYGFLAENADFAQACTDAGHAFIGPSTASIRLMGSKIASRRLASEAGVPVVPGTEDAVASLKEACRIAAEMSYPVVLKASSGGGGKGLRVVQDEVELRSVYETARGEARSSFKDPTVFLEKCLERPRHVEIQLLGDAHGMLIHLGERECSIQRRHQKVLEESPSPLVTPELRERMGRAALAVARAADYHNAGTVEFLVETGPGGEFKSFYFLEMNTRLQVEHPVTEMVTGIDLVQEQIRLAAGEKLRLRQADVQLKGWALECRIYAEDPLNHFYPSPGTIVSLFEPSGPGIRNDSGVYAGCDVPLHYDALISKLVAWGQDRRQATSRMLRALREYRIEGIRTTIPFFDVLLAHPEFVRGDLHTGFIAQHRLIEQLQEPGLEELTVPLSAAALFFQARKRAVQTLHPASGSAWKTAAWRRSPYWKGWGS